MRRTVPSTIRHLVLVFGDQLDERSAAFDGFNPAEDAVLQMEVRDEATYIPQHRLRIAFFFAAMRHFHEALRQRGWPAHYARIDDRANRQGFASEIRRWWERLRPERLVTLEPGDWRVRNLLLGSGLPIELRADRHFLASVG
jgi:deoxyribodipyrimidine photolyase-related protein